MDKRVVGLVLAALFAAGCADSASDAATPTVTTTPAATPTSSPTLEPSPVATPQPTPEPGASHNVTMWRSTMRPDPVEIEAGDEVCWYNINAGAKHQIVGDEGEFDTGIFGWNETRCVVIDWAGEIPYHEVLYGGSLRGTIISR